VGFGKPQAEGNPVSMGTDPAGKSSKVIIGVVLDFIRLTDVLTIIEIRFGILFLIPDIGGSDRLELEMAESRLNLITMTK